MGGAVAYEPTAGELALPDVAVWDADAPSDDVFLRLALDGCRAAVVVRGARPVYVVWPTGVVAATVVAAGTPIGSVATEMARGTEPDGLSRVVVVGGDDRVVGVLETSALAGYTARERRRTRSAPDTPVFRPLPIGVMTAPEPLRLQCRTCGTVNEVPSLRRGVTACVSGHVLVPAWPAG